MILYDFRSLAVRLGLNKTYYEKLRHIFIAIELLDLCAILDGTQNYEVQWNYYVECNIVIFFEKSLNTIQNFKRDVVYCWAQKYQSKGTLAKGERPFLLQSCTWYICCGNEHISTT